MDRLALELDMLFAVAGIAAVLMSWRGIAPRESGHGEWSGLLIFSVLGMGVFVAAQNLITLFLGIELLSIPLYILCASETRREGSLESGLKYLVVGSVGSATRASTTPRTSAALRHSSRSPRENRERLANENRPVESAVARCVSTQSHEVIAPASARPRPSVATP